MTGILNLLAGAVSSVIKDTYFNLVTLLLPGNGTNGAQNNTFLDSSSNNFTITRNGNTTQGTFSPFQPGWSNYFNGSSYLSAANNISLTGDFTVEAWIFTPARSAANAILQIGNEATGRIIFYVGASNQLAYAVFGSADTNLNGSVPVNAWAHIAFVRSGTTITAYINGIATGTTGTVSGTVGNSAQFSIAASPTPGNYLTGYVSNLRVTTGALYTGSFTPSTTPLTTTVSAGSVSLLTCQDNRFRDASANNFALTVNGAPSVQAFSPFAPTAAYSAATNGGSGYFDGTGDYLNSTITALGSGAFTIEGWVYFTGSVASKGVFHAATATALPSTVSGVAVASGSSGGWTLYYNNGSQNTNTSLTAALNTWIHIALVKSGTTLSLYVNGVLNQSQTDTANYTNQAIAIGSFYSTAQCMNGYVSGFRVIVGTAAYSGTSTTTPNFTLPSAPPSPTGTNFCLNFTNGGITDATAKNDLETVGNAQISTTQSKWGGSSISLDGTGDWLTLPITANTIIPASSSFTIEGWFRLNSVPGGYAMMLSDSGGASSKYFAINGSRIDAQFGSAAGTTAYCSYTFSANTWYHIALVRNGTTVNIYVDGISQTMTQGTQSNSFLDQGALLYVGRFGGTTAYEFNGYIDDFRITKGYARYTANFTPPTAAFPLQ